jgi:dihydrofolate reductase
MRKLIVSNIMSLDGYYEGPGNNVMVMPMDEAFDTYNAERLRSADTMLLGRNSYEGFKGFWPPINDDPDVHGVLREDPDARETLREISRLQNAMEKVVVSDTLTSDETSPWQDNTRIVRRADAHAAVAELKERDGKDILMFGSRTLWNDLLAAGLVDELHLMVGAVTLGDGTPSFDADPNISFHLIGTRTWDDSENVVLIYEVRPEAQSPSR